MTMKRPQPQQILKFKQASKAAAMIPPTPKDDGSVFAKRHLGHYIGDWGDYYNLSWFVESHPEKRRRLKRSRAKAARKARK